MLVSQIAYVILIAAAITIIPFRIRAHRQTLKEIEALRSSFKQSVEELVKKVQSRAATEKERRTDWLQAFAFKLASRQVYEFRGYASVAKFLSTKDIARCVPSLRGAGEAYYFWTKKPRVEVYRELRTRGESDIYPVEEAEEPWVVATAHSRAIFLASTHRSKLVATP